MPVITESEARVFRMHGSTFSSFVSPTVGSSQLCSWILDVTAGSEPTAHRVSHEEVLFVLDGELRMTLDGQELTAAVGDAVFVPAGSRIAVGSGPDGARAWVSTSVGLSATTADGVIHPPWVR